MADRITYVGLDVHKESIVVAVAVGGLRGEVAGVRPDREHADGVGPSVAQARRRRHDAAVFATKRGLAGMASSVACRPGDTSAS